MTRATGIHIAHDILRLACIERAASDYRLCTLFKTQLPLPLLPDVLAHPPDRKQLANSIKQALLPLKEPLGSIVPSLGGGFFQIQKIPLELASPEERQEQICWEASQTLIDPITHYSINYHPAGRTAFWMAVRKEVLDLYSELFAPAGIIPASFEVEPLALFYACQLAQSWSSARSAAVLLGNAWLCFVSAENNVLVSAEIASLSPNLSNQSEKPSSLTEETYEMTRRWIYGDRTPDRRRTVYHQALFCAEDRQAQSLFKRFRTPDAPRLALLQPFSTCSTQTLPKSQHHLLSEQPLFGIAAGLAYRGLTKELT